MTGAIRIAPIETSHRPQIEEIVRATGVFSEEEVAVALELFDATYEAKMENGEWRMGSTPLSISDAPFSQSDYEFVGAFSGDTLVGYACFGPTPATDRTYDLYWIAVHPSAQRSGAGASLMMEVEHQLESRRGRLLVIETSSRDDYAPTRRFYQKRGYEEGARLRDFYALGDDRVVLTKRLSDGPASPPASSGYSPLPATRI